MIKIELEEAYAFDMYSILEVKYEKQDSQKNLENLQNFGEQIESAIGSAKFEDVLASDEYSFLKNLNSTLFDFIDDVKNGDEEITAKDIDDLNYSRWEAKRDLQAEFFDQEIQEVKIGYEKS